MNRTTVKIRSLKTIYFTDRDNKPISFRNVKETSFDGCWCFNIFIIDGYWQLSSNPPTVTSIVMVGQGITGYAYLTNGNNHETGRVLLGTLCSFINIRMRNMLLGGKITHLIYAYSYVTMILWINQCSTGCEKRLQYNWLWLLILFGCVDYFALFVPTVPGLIHTIAKTTS